MRRLLALLIVKVALTYNVTVHNLAHTTLFPTAEGLRGGCIGGSLPDQPVRSGDTRTIKLHLLRYSDTCFFNVLPEPSVLTLPLTCTGVKPGDTVVFSGGTVPNVTCEMN